MTRNIGLSSSRAYCTYFDGGYLNRGLALISSLREHGDESPVYVLALDDSVAEYFERNALPNVILLRVEELEKVEPALIQVKPERSRMEYYFTCTPLLIRYVMNRFTVADSVAIYLDADLFFFDDPGLVVQALEKHSVGIIEHRYPDSVARKLSKYGRFNVGWLGFRNDLNGRNVLDWYAKQTLAWCFDTPEGGKYADQGYLDWFPNFPGVKILSSAGFNLAPWNTRRHNLMLSNLLDTNDSGNRDSVSVDGNPLVFFHFHGLREVGNWWVTGQLIYRSPLTKILRDHVYQPYINLLSSTDKMLRPDRTSDKTKIRGRGIKGLLSRVRKSAVNGLSIVTGNAVRAEN